MGSYIVGSNVKIVKPFKTVCESLYQVKNTMTLGSINFTCSLNICPKKMEKSTRMFTEVKKGETLKIAINGWMGKNIDCLNNGIKFSHVKDSHGYRLIHGQIKTIMPHERGKTE